MRCTLQFDDLLPKDSSKQRRGSRLTKDDPATDGDGAAKSGAREKERIRVHDALARYFPDIKSIHAYYANQNGAEAEQVLGASAFTIDRQELKIFLLDCGLLDKTLPQQELVTIVRAEPSTRLANLRPGWPTSATLTFEPPAVDTGADLDACEL